MDEEEYLFWYTRVGDVCNEMLGQGKRLCDVAEILTGMSQAIVEALDPEFEGSESGYLS